MNRFQTLQLLVSSLSLEEKRSCRKFLKASNETGGKSFRLFQMLEKPTGKSTNEDTVALALYGRKKSNAFARLQLRLQDKILEVLSQEEHIRRQERNERSIQRILLRRKLNHADVLLSRKMFDLAKTVFEKIEETAEKYELFDEVLASLQLQVELANTRKDFELVQSLHLDILFCRQRITVITSAYQILEMLRNTLIEEIPERLARLKDYAKEAPSSMFSFLLLGIDALEAERKQSYKAVDEMLKQQLTIARDSPALNDWNRIGGIYLELAKNSIRLQQIEKAKIYLMDAEHWLKDDLLQEQVEVRKLLETHA